MMRWVVGALFVSCAAARCEQVDAEREKDVYAIYSLMMTNPQTSHGPGGNERYLIRDTTAPGNPEQPCVVAPANRKTEFQGVLDEFAKRKGTERRLERKLNIDQPYELLSADEVKQFIEERRLRRDSPARSDRFRGVIDVWTLSDVYFNEKRTLALTAISSWCGSLCALWRWKVFEKGADGKWHEQRDWASCFTIS